MDRNRTRTKGQQKQWLHSNWADVRTRGGTQGILTDGAASPRLGEYRRCLDLFDGNDETALAAARERWRRAQFVHS